MPSPYSTKIKAECKMMYIDKEMSYKAISEWFNGTPTPQCVANWAVEKPKGGGLSWKEEKELKVAEYYSKLSPRSIARKMLERVNYLLNKDVQSWDAKHADALVKTARALRDLAERNYQIPMLFEFLEKLIVFLNHNYKEVLSGEFKNILKQFQAEMLKELEGKDKYLPIGKDKNG